MDDVVEFFEVTIHQMKKEMDEIIEEYRARLPRCPDCSTTLSPFSVNTDPRNQIGGDWNILWTCDNPECDYDRLSHGNIKDWILPHPKEREIQRILAPFAGTSLQGILELNDWLKHTGRSMSEVEEFVAQGPSRFREEVAARRMIIKKCPECGRAMHLRTGFDNDCYWLCSCSFSEYEPRPMGDVINEWREKNG